MKRLTALATLLAATIACTVTAPQQNSLGPRSVKFPLVDYNFTAFYGAGNRYMEIEEVCLTDTATTILMHSHSFPGADIRFSKMCKLITPGHHTYNIKGIDKFPLGVNWYIGEEGHDTFTLIFEPMPFDTEVFDITEGPGNRFKITGIDITPPSEPIQPNRWSLNPIQRRLQK